jgi:activator of HSP90 ATPase
MTYDFEVSSIVLASSEEIFRAWMSSEGHSAMTGGEAVIDPKIGGEFNAWDGYISGRTIELEPSQRIVQSWRTTQFGDGDEDSQIEVLLNPVDEGTLVTIRHTKVPAGHRGYEDGGWQRSYFDPMCDYFASR